jgi:hypothetical protein
MSSSIPNIEKEPIDKNVISKLNKNTNTSNLATHSLNNIDETIINNEIKQNSNDDDSININKYIEVINPKINNNPKKRKRNRCYQCNIRVGLLGFECSCNHLFCSKHRLPENHQCDIDYKESGRKLIEKQNPCVIKDKIDNRI